MFPWSTRLLRCSGIFASCVFASVCGWTRVAEGDVSPAASASTEPARVADARKYFGDGSRSAQLGLFADALGAFEASSRLREHALTLYYVGYCQRMLGRWTLARAAFLRALERDRATQPPELTTEQRTAARNHLADVEKGVARLDVVLPPTTGIISVDDAPLEANPGEPTLMVAGTRAKGAGEAPPGSEFSILLDPGEHTLVFEPSGGPALSVVKTLASGSRAPLRFGSEPADTSRPVVELAHPEQDIAPGSKPNTTLGWSLVGGGTVFVAEGIAAQLLAYQRASVYNDNSRCLYGNLTRGQRCGAYRDDATLAQGLAIGGFAIGGALVAVGAYSLWRTGRAAKPSHAFLLVPDRSGAMAVWSGPLP
jgi:hypothetical protein